MKVKKKMHIEERFGVVRVAPRDVSRALLSLACRSSAKSDPKFRSYILVDAS